MSIVCSLLQARFECSRAAFHKYARMGSRHTQALPWQCAHASRAPSSSPPFHHLPLDRARRFFFASYMLLVGVRGLVNPRRAAPSVLLLPGHPYRPLHASPLCFGKKRAGKMAPKKQAAAEPKARLGKVSNNLKMGIVGMPNVGKSSFFNCLAKADLGKAANFPYATIDPEETRVPVPDERFEWLCRTYKPKNEVPAFLTCIDIAGLTAGASTGAGLGNAFLSHVRNVDGIFQVVRA